MSHDDTAGFLIETDADDFADQGAAGFAPETGATAQAQRVVRAPGQVSAAQQLVNKAKTLAVAANDGFTFDASMCSGDFLRSPAGYRLFVNTLQGWNPADLHLFAVAKDLITQLASALEASLVAEGSEECEELKAQLQKLIGS